MQDVELLPTLAEITGVFVGFGALIEIRSGRSRSGGRGSGGASAAALFVALALVSVAGCAAGDAPSVPASPTQATASAPLPASPSASTPPSPSSGAGGLDAQSTMEAVIADLMAAIGNPDTGAESEAMTAFKAALESGDATRITSTAKVILGHLADGRAMIAAVAGPGCEVFCPEWDQMLLGIDDGITAMRDAGIAGSSTGVDEGGSRIQAALLDHFWQGVKAYDPNLYVRYLPDGRTVNASRMRWSTDPGAAFDGNEESAWTTGDAPAPQWIEVDLGFVATLESVRLLAFQDVAGPTDHRVIVCGADGMERELVRFTGETADRRWLEHAPAKAVSDVRVIRVTTLATPSMIGWREIEVKLEAGQAPRPSPTRGEMSKCGTDALATGATATGEPSAVGHEPAMAIDGDPATGWAPGNAGVLKIALAGIATVSEVRLLVGEPAGGSADYTFLAVLPSNERFMLGQLSGPTEAGVWRSVSNPTPSIAFREMEVLVQSASPAAELLEIQVVGRALR